uniref:Reverse transcriptase Ty1/copia-type domain-containing protein n=1 Tax=Cajanus cajan TaxID=3821 RepID=A0A151RAF3_CAJCA|nr:hypothetical protein KK1_039171 [Cajanus cajan]
MAYLLLYVDDIILTASSDELRKSIISLLSLEFAMKDLGHLSYFLGINVTRHASGLFLSQRIKYIEMDIHFVRGKVARGQVRVLHVPSCYQIADIFTKGLPLVLFEDFRDSLSIQRPPASTAGVC